MSGVCKSCFSRALACAGMAALMACAGNEPSLELDESHRNLESEGIAAEAIVPESVSPQAVVVGWDGSVGGEVVDKLAAVVESTAATALNVEVVLNIRAPDGQSTEEVLRSAELAAKEKLRLDLPVANLPVQSAGVASMLDLSVRYRAPGGDLLRESAAGAPGEQTFVARAPALYLTHESTFGKAAARSAAEEARFNGLRYRAGQLPRVSEIRGSKARAVRGAAAAAAPVQFMMRFPPGAPDAPPPPTAQE